MPNVGDETAGNEAEKASEIVEHQTSAREVLEREKKTEEMLRERASADPDAMESGQTPLATMLALKEAFKNQDYKRAARFLDMRYLPDDMDTVKS